MVMQSWKRARQPEMLLPIRLMYDAVRVSTEPGRQVFVRAIQGIDPVRPPAWWYKAKQTKTGVYVTVRYKSSIQRLVIRTIHSQAVMDLISQREWFPPEVAAKRIG
jgi:hypothetical protein